MEVPSIGAFKEYAKSTYRAPVAQAIIRSINRLVTNQHVALTDPLSIQFFEAMQETVCRREYTDTSALRALGIWIDLYKQPTLVGANSGDTRPTIGNWSGLSRKRFEDH